MTDIRCNSLYWADRDDECFYLATSKHFVRSADAQASAPVADSISIHQISYRFAAGRWLYLMFWSTSCSIESSKDRSATNRLTFVFSSRNCFNSRASEGSSPP
jgi:hypothetical protein